MSPECSQMSPECSEMFFRPRQMSGASQKAAKMTAGRREFGGKNRTAAGDSDLHRNGKSWKLGKKNLPFRRTPESLQEIPIYIGMVKVGN